MFTAIVSERFIQSVHYVPEQGSYYIRVDKAWAHNDSVFETLQHPASRSVRRAPDGSWIMDVCKHPNDPVLRAPTIEQALALGPRCRVQMPPLPQLPPLPVLLPPLPVLR